MSRLQVILHFLPGFILGLTVHEYAHALVALWLGDGYPASQGRVSLNPFRHLSPLGTLAIAVLGVGWARPVEVNIHNFRRPRRDFLLTALAGPASNIVLMMLLAGLVRLGPGLNDRLRLILLLGARINGILAVINLLPIPPLDGSRLWPVLIPHLKLLNRNRLSFLWVVLVLAIFRLGLLDRLFLAVGNVVNGLAGL